MGMKEDVSLSRGFSVKTRVGMYELGRTLGEGSFAKVKLAKHVGTGCLFAIKILDKATILKHDMVELTKREISTMKRLMHPNIVQLHEVMASKTKVYFVLEYVEGGRLFDKMRQQRILSETVARKYFQQLINAVDHCHSQGVYHRDLKLENLLLDAGGNLKISDFGLSALSEQCQNDCFLRTVCGTPSYIAPEVVYHKGYNGAKSDIWSCGVILFEMMAGFLPFEDDNILQLYKKIRKGEFKCPPWFSSSAASFIKKILNPLPKQRLTVSQMLEDPWFKEDYKPETFTINERVNLDDVDALYSESNVHFFVEKKKTQVSRPTLLNAFDLICLSPNVNLSGLFEVKQVDQDVRFASRYPANEIVMKMEETAKSLGFSVEKRDYKMTLHGGKPVTKGRLSIAIEVFEVAASFFMVEMRKTCGDALEFHKFCNSFSLGLKDVVWQTEAVIDQPAD